ncbi:MAG: hypothetical protein ACK4GC_16575, partial [Paracoccaceae bacterium]
MYAPDLGTMTPRHWLRRGDGSGEINMQTKTRTRALPALVLGALMGATALTALTPAVSPAQAYAVQPGGYADLVAR